MKTSIHPQWFNDAKVVCSCGNTFTVGATKKDIHVDICSTCHPFYTGEERIIDTARRVEKFQAKRAALAATGPKVKKVKDATRKAKKEEAAKAAKTKKTEEGK